MSAWHEQPPAVRATLNPLLIAGVLAWTSEAYRRRAGVPMPWPLAFVTPGLVLHSPSRQALPKTTSRRLLAWREEHAELVAGLPDRSLALRPFIQTGLRVGLRHQLLTLESTGVRGSLPASRTPSELKDLRASAALVGRWLAPLPASAVLAQLGMAL